MKKVLFAGLLAIAGVSVSAQNLINRQETPSIRMP